MKVPTAPPVLAPTARCTYRSCGFEIQGHRLFCWPHWRRIPIALRDRLARIQTHRFTDLLNGRPTNPADAQLVAEAVTAIDASYQADATRTSRSA